MKYEMKEGSHRATIYLDKFLIDKGTMSQLRKLIVHPATQHMRVMPDCHRGNGCCVGYTSQLTTKIVPKFIGGDIGCGMISYPFKSDGKSLDLEKIDADIRLKIPMGSKQIHPPNLDLISRNRKYLNQIWDKVIDEAYQFAFKYKQKYKIDIRQYVPDYSWKWYIDKCQQIQTDPQYELLSLGTLGGGNHFIEIGKGNINDKLYITIHSGSRSMGQKICQYHQQKINDTKYIDRDALQKMEKKLSRQYQDKRLYQYLSEYKEKLISQKHPDYLEDEEAFRYYFDMIFAQNFAQLNRKIMLDLILEILNIKYTEDIEIESIHNYIDFDDFIIRKGAIQAKKDELCLIALNMKEGILLCRGKSNPEWNYSSAHGAGRVINRQEAYQKLSFQKFKDEMNGIYSTSVVKETLDESPMVYRNSEIIKKGLKDTIDIIAEISPIINLKGLD